MRVLRLKILQSMEHLSASLWHSINNNLSRERQLLIKLPTDFSCDLDMKFSYKR